MARPLADYVKLPELDEYKEWFKAFADLKREDGILQVTWKTNDGPMHHSGMSHRAMSQLTRILSMDWKNEIIIYTHIGDNWMIESDANGWETYSELPTQRFQHQYFDDTNLIKNMVFDLDVPTIGDNSRPWFPLGFCYAVRCYNLHGRHQNGSSSRTGRSGSRRRHGPDGTAFLWNQARQLLHDDFPSVYCTADAGLGHGQRSCAQGQSCRARMGNRTYVEENVL